MAIDKLGNGVGYVYVTDSNNNIVINWPNTAASVRPFLNEALVSGPLSGEVLATTTVTNTVFSSPGTSITNITVNGISIITGTISSNTLSTLITNTVASINSKISSPDYVAYENGTGTSFIIGAIAGTGSTPNGYVVVVTSTNSTFTSPAMSGGATTSGAYSTAVNGRRFYIYADSAAVIGNISGATEVTSQVIQRGSQAGISTASATIATNSISPTRAANFQKITIDTSGGGATDTLNTITTSGYIDGDVLEFVGASAARITTFAVVGGAGSILLANSAPFLTGDATNSIQLQYSASLGQWVEIFRSPGLNFTASSVRAQSIPWPVYGVTSTVLTNGGGTITLTPGVSKNYLYLSGSPSLAANWSVVGAGSPIDGDTFYVSYRATPTLNGNTITIFGATLTSTQALSGKVAVRATYRSAASAYDVDVFNDVTSVDWATVASVAAKEDSLGNPASNGYVLSSTTGGVRTWIPMSSSSSGNNVLSAPAFANVGTGADTVETILKTYTLLANTLFTNESQIVIEARGYFGADANTKSVKIYFGTQAIGTWTSTSNNLSFKLRTTVTRSAITTQFGDTEIITSGGGTTNLYVNVLTQDLSADTVIKITGTNGSAVADDIVVSYMSVKIFTK